MQATLSHYRVLEQIGAGGMGVVYRAHDERLERDVALKVLPAGALADEAAHRRFRKEALALSKLSHPNIATVFDFDSENGTDFLVEELIPGLSLDELLVSGPLSEKEIVNLGSQLCDGLAAAHEHSIVHRDLKPSNIRVTPDGRVKILDFGLAKVMRMASMDSDTGQTASFTETQHVSGTLPYMAPEQLLNRKQDERTDVWAAGCVLYEMATGNQPFPGSGPTLIDGILHQQPRAPSTLNPQVLPGLEAIIQKCLDKAPELRYAFARDIAEDLRRLSAGTAPAALAARRRAAWRLRISVILPTLLVAAFLWWVFHRSGRNPIARRPTAIAVLPFQNLAGDKSTDFLRFALPDQVETVLSYSPTLSVRPSAATRKYAQTEVDPQAVGHELRVANVVTGAFIRQGDSLRVTLELVQVDDNRVAWHDSIIVPAQQMITLEEQINGRLRRGLLPLLGGPATEMASQPKNPEAFDLYLRANALPSDLGPTKEAINMLERAVDLDPTYAPAWDALGRRYYFDAAYYGGGEAAMKRSDSAYERAVALDSNLLSARSHANQNRVEKGDFAKAYQEAHELVTRRPENAQAHFTLSYALRYAGLLDEAARECNTAVALDPGNIDFRNCAITFLEMGQTDRAMDFLKLDYGSEWATGVLPSILLRAGKLAEARQAVRKMTANPTWYPYLLSACLDPQSPREIDDAALKALPALLAERDSELRYYEASILAYCGKTEAAVKLTRSAIDSNYCAYDALARDPLIAKVRATPEYPELRAVALKCQQRFMSEAGRR